MGLYDQWKELIEQERDQKGYDRFWKEYLAKETAVYEQILENSHDVPAGKLAELAGKYDMEPLVFSGFIDGINTSLEEPYTLEELTEESDIQLKVDFEKLYFNMLDAKAEWLYTLSQWEGVLSEERRDEIRKEFNRSKMAVSSKIGRNDPCPCGSGKKYKKCCGA